MARPRNETLRARLIDAATDAFAEHGYAGATLDDIGARAGVTKGGVYFHFHGKEALFYAVLDHWRQLRRRRLQVPAVGPLGAAAALREFLAGYLAFHFEAPAATHLLRVLATELRSRLTSRLREDERQELRWLRASIRDLLGQGGRDGSMFVEDPAFAAFQIAASVTGVLEQWQTSGAEVKAFCFAEPLAASLVARWQTQGRPPDPAAGAPEFDFRGGRGG